MFDFMKRVFRFNADSSKRNVTDYRIVRSVHDDDMLPDGSRVIYAESPKELILYKKCPAGKATVYTFNRNTGTIYLDGNKANQSEKKTMLDLGIYFMSNVRESDMVSLSVAST